MAEAEEEMSLGASDVLKRIQVAMPGTPAAALARSLLGCQWGGIVATADDMAECIEQATSITFVHEGPEDGAGVPLKLCDRHRAALLELTDPHATEGGEDAG